MVKDETPLDDPFRALSSPSTFGSTSTINTHFSPHQQLVAFFRSLSSLPHSRFLLPVLWLCGKGGCSPSPVRLRLPSPLFPLAQSFQSADPSFPRPRSNQHGLSPCRAGTSFVSLRRPYWGFAGRDSCCSGCAHASTRSLLSNSSRLFLLSEQRLARSRSLSWSKSRTLRSRRWKRQKERTRSSIPEVLLPTEKVRSISRFLLFPSFVLTYKSTASRPRHPSPTLEPLAPLRRRRTRWTCPLTAFRRRSDVLSSRLAYHFCQEDGEQTYAGAVSRALGGFDRGV